MTAKPKRPSPPDEEHVRDISEWIYRHLLEGDNYPGAVQRMLDKDADGGRKLRNRAEAYDRLTRAYLRAREAGVMK